MDGASSCDRADVQRQRRFRRLRQLRPLRSHESSSRPGRAATIFASSVLQRSLVSACTSRRDKGAAKMAYCDTIVGTVGRLLPSLSPIRDRFGKTFGTLHVQSDNLGRRRPPRGSRPMVHLQCTYADSVALPSPAWKRLHLAREYCLNRNVAWGTVPRWKMSPASTSRARASFRSDAEYCDVAAKNS
jgi:hypothetical protein